MKRKLKNIGRFLPIWGVLVDTNDQEDVKYFNSVGFRGGLYVLLRYVIF